MEMKENGKYKQLYQNYFDVQEEKAEVTKETIEVVKEEKEEPIQEDIPKEVIDVEQEPKAESANEKELKRKNLQNQK